MPRATAHRFAPHFPLVGFSPPICHACGQCKNRTCANKGIRKGELRLGRVSAAQTYDGDITEWFHPRCMFETIIRGRALTRKIEDVNDITGFDKLPKADQDTIRALLAEAKPKYKRPPGYQPVPTAPVSVPTPAPKPAPKAEPKAEPKTPEVTGVRLVATDGSCSVLFTGLGPHTIGRNCAEFAAKQHVREFSRVQAVVTLRAGGPPTLESLGVNPTVLTRADADGASRVLAHKEVVALEDGCHVAFCAMPELDFLVQFCTATDASSPATGTVSEAAPAKKRARTTTVDTHSDSDSTDDDDDDDDGDEDYDPRPWCKYGAACYRKNEQHLRDFRHPHKR